MTAIEAPSMTGYMHLPPLWVLDEFDRTDITSSHVGLQVDVERGAEIARAISEHIAVCVARDGFVAFAYAEGARIGGTGNAPEMLAAACRLPTRRGRAARPALGGSQIARPRDPPGVTRRPGGRRRSGRGGAVA